MHENTGGKMPLTKDQKECIVSKFRIHEKDTGSSEVQIALLSKRIKDLTEHFKIHRKDHHSKRGLLKIIGQRKRFITYLKRTNLQKYKEIIKELGIRR